MSNCLHVSQNTPIHFNLLKITTNSPHLAVVDVELQKIVVPLAVHKKSVWMNGSKSQLNHSLSWIRDFSQPVGDEFFAVESHLSAKCVCQSEREENQ